MNTDGVHRRDDLLLLNLNVRYTRSAFYLSYT